MAEKPKTYPQQIQELKQQIIDKDDQLNEALQRLSFVEEMQNEIAYLREQLEIKANAEAQDVRTDKAKSNDAEQRAVQAEAQAKALQNKVKSLEYDLVTVETQLEAMRREAVNQEELQRKLDSYAEQMQIAHNRIAQVTSAANDKIAQAKNETDAISNELRTLRMAARYHENQLATLKESYESRLAESNKQNDSLFDAVVRLREEQQINTKIIKQFRTTLENVPDIKKELTALLNRAAVAESTI